VELPWYGHRFYGVLYAYAAYRIDRAVPIISVGLAGKILGPIGWLMVVNSGEWPLRTFTLIVFNDLIWWLPFGLFLLDETRSGKWLRHITPWAYATINALAALVMLFALRGGTEAASSFAERTTSSRNTRCYGEPVGRYGWRRQ
jgi:hypothetical protein